MKTWQPEEETLLREMVAKDKTYKQIAALLGRSYSCVGTKIKRLELTNERGSEEARAKAARRAPERHVKQLLVGKPCPPPAMDLMHRDVYVPPKPYCPREEGLEAFLLPSGAYQPAVTYHESHP